MDKLQALFKQPLPRELRDLSRVFADAGFSAWLVGGAVRDRLMGCEVDDWDVATDARPEEVVRIFKRTIPTGIQHGTVTVLFKGKKIEVTTLRTEADYRDGRHPDKVEWTGKIEEDLGRRDFTINAMALRLDDESLVDPYGGRNDLKKAVIRCVGIPAHRFAEDALRLLRAIRFASRLDFSLETETLAAIPPLAGSLARVSVERIQAEFSKMLLSKRPSRSIRLLDETGLLAVFLPELVSCKGIEQKGRHAFDVFEHLLHSLDGMESSRLDLRLAALLHDIGKPSVRALDGRGDWTFYRHEEVSADMARDILTRLRYPLALVDTVTHLVREHMFHYEETWTDAALRRFMRRVGTTQLNDLLTLRRADMYGTRGERPPPGALLGLIDRIDAEIVKGSALSLKDLAVNGKDLAAEGIPPGPWMGRILAELLETVTDSPEMNTREKLLPLAKALETRRAAGLNMKGELSD